MGRPVWLLPVFCFAALLQGCASADLKLAASQPAPDWVYIHPDAKVGDRAEWKNAARRHHYINWEVVAEHGDDLEVTLAWQNETGSGGSEQKGLRRHFIIGRDGTVKRAFARNFKTGKQVEMRVAKPGEVIVKRERIPLDTPQTITTPAGTFTVSEVLIQHYHYRVLVTSLDTAAVEFIDPAASFGVVRSIQDIDIAGLVLARLTAAVGEVKMNPSPTTLYTALSELELNNKIKQNFHLEAMR